MSAATTPAPRMRRRRPGAEPGPAPARGRHALAGTGTLYRFALRRDRVRLTVWVLALVLGTLATASNFAQTYPEAADRASTAETLDSPAGLAMTGPAHYLDDYTLGSMLGHQMLGFVAVMAGLMSVLAVVRHTREEEETGRAELLRSGVVGRHASLTAALAVAATANVALALLFALGLPSLGLDGVGYGGALVYGAAHAAVGLVFAAVAAVTVQFTAHGRAASGGALAVLGAAYALRAAGDVGGGALSWISPIGWAQRSYPFVDDRWWPLLLALAAALAAASAGYALSTRRDVGAGLRPPRAGRAAATGFLTTPLGFALRLHRGLLGGFCAALLLLGAMYGSILGDVEDMLKDIDAVREAMEKAGGSSMAESFAATVMIMPAVLASVHVVMAALRPRAEENAGRAEPLLATALSRTRWVGGHLLVAAVGGTVVLLVGGLAFGLTGAASTGDASLIGTLTASALVHAPALWVTMGVAVLLYGWAPRAVALVWAVPVYGFLVGYLGKLLDFPEALHDLSPFGHVPELPAAEMSWLPLVLLTALAAALVALGLHGVRRRDLETK